MKRIIKKSLPVVLFSLFLIGFTTIFCSIAFAPKYDIDPNLGETLSNNVVVDITDDGTMIMKETMKFKTTAREIFKDISYNGGYVPNGTHTPSFDTSAVYVKAYDESGTVIIEGNGNANIGSSSSSQMLQFSWKNGVTAAYGGYPSVRVEPEENCVQPAETMYLYKSDKFSPVVYIEYTYAIKGAVVLFNDTAEINWKFATTNSMRTSNVNVTINLPTTVTNTVNKDDIYIYGHGTDGKVVHEDANPFQIKLSSKKLLPEEEIEARIMFPTNLVDTSQFSTSSGYHNVYNDNHIAWAVNFEKAQNDAGHKVYVRTQIVTYTSYSVCAVLLVASVFLFIRVYRKYDKEYHSDFFGEYYRELPAEYGPAVMGYLYREKEVNKNDVSATLLDLIRRGFITIDYQGESLTSKKPNYKMILTELPRKDLKPYENKLIDWFFGVVAKGNVLTLDQLDDFNRKEPDALKYQRCNKEFNQQIINDSVKENFFESTKKAKQVTSSIGGIYFLVSVILIIIGMTLDKMIAIPFIIASIGVSLALIFANYGANINRRTIKGNEDYVRWVAFKKFLEEFSNIKDYPMPGITVWEHYMVYATAFGIAELVEKQLRFKYSQMNMEKEMANSTYLRYPSLSYYYMARISAAHHIGTQTVAKAAAARSSSNGGGGGRGGFGGGSSFGGGGSGMRMR